MARINDRDTRPARGLIAVLVLAASAGAQSKPDAITVLERAHEAIDAVDTFRFHSRRTLMGSLSSRAPSIEADVRAGRLEGDERFPWKIVIEGEAAASAERGAHGFVFAYDGKSVTAGDSAERIARVSSPKTIFTAAKPNAIVAANWLLRWDQLVRDPIIEKKFTHIITYDGEAMVDGELCHVVRMELSEFPQVDEYEFWWFISAEDYLPRRTDALYYDVGGVGTGFESIVITGLEADGPMRESELRLTIPSGYTVEEVKEEEVAAKEDPRRGGGGGLVGKPAPDFTLKSTTGETVSLQDFRGQVVVLDFWATWCGPCRMAMPSLQKVHEKYGGAGAVVLGLNCWENADPDKFMKDNKFTYATLLQADSVASAYGVSGIPTLVVVGKDGTIAGYEVGFRADLEQHLSGIIDEAKAK